MESPQPSQLQAAIDIHKLIVEGKVTSVELINACFDRIEEGESREPKLNAIISTSPREIALDQARKLDEELKNGKPRSRLHGVPIIVKVCKICKSMKGKHLKNP